MEGSISDEQAHTWLQEVADAGYISLHFDNPGLGGADRAELVGGSYKRMKMSWSQPNNRAIWALEDARFTGLAQTKVAYFGIWSMQNQGFLRAWAELPAVRMVLTGKGFVIPAGRIVLSVG